MSTYCEGGAGVCELTHIPHKGECKQPLDISRWYEALRYATSCLVIYSKQAPMHRIQVSLDDRCQTVVGWKTMAAVDK